MTDRKEKHIFEKYLGLRVVIELKDSHKYFGTLKEVDTSPEHWSWIVIIDKEGNSHTFADSEIRRLENDPTEVRGDVNSST